MFGLHRFVFRFVFRFCNVPSAEASVLASLAPLFVELFGVCANGVIPNLKSVTALTNCHAANPLYQSKENILTWAPTVAGMLRMVAYHYREVYMHADKLDTCLKKAWGLQKIDWAT